MSRSLLLVICDFLLLSLLALARFDDPKEQEQTQELTAEELAAADSAVDKDLVEILKLSLEAEKAGTEDLAQTLEQTRESLEAREKTLAEKEERLSKVEMTAEQLAAEKAAIEKARAEAEAERERLAQEAATIQEKLRTADTERVELAKSLAEAKETSAVSSERLKSMQEEMQEQQRMLENLRQERERLASEKAIAEQEKLTLESKLTVAEAEARVFATTLQTARADIEATREEKKAIQQTADKLAEGVGVLAESTRGIQEEVKALQPQSLNTLFDRYRSNRVRLVFETQESTLFGTTSGDYTADTMLAGDGERLYAIVHIDETPFRTSGLKAVSAQLEMGGRVFRIPQVGFLASDPRIVAVAIPQSLAESNGVEPFNLSKDPLRYPDAVLIDSGQNYYGESPFKLDPADPRYVRFKSDLFSRIFGEFSPNRGDIVLAKTGEFLGIMVNNSYGLVVPALSSRATLSLGEDFSEERADSVRKMVNTVTNRLPEDLR
ncbi:hypothetical protein [Rubellicoccus peritrichatus]|uniref:Uncharacterized protein n=1 Tax=Rubellicoccus peritrichatus TaxID=3080537 RepID=A0AAQ3QRU0_9BACT|nr:hypothetical protein [Puniceicoccus sp. CR14]WOO41633.1 hypothetical protein RZN69_00935 [Puniceicoccus sp. CR14]